MQVNTCHLESLTFLKGHLQLLWPGIMGMIESSNDIDGRESGRTGGMFKPRGMCVCLDLTATGMDIAHGSAAPLKPC